MKWLFSAVLTCFVVIGVPYQKSGAYAMADTSGAQLHRKSKKVIVFDFGGVIGGTDSDEVARMLAPELGMSQDEASILVRRCRDAKKRGVPPQSFWDDFELESGVVLPEGWTLYFEELKRLAIKADPEMLRLVERLQTQGYRVAMLSNVTEPRARFIRALGVYDHFDPAILSCEIGVSKPQAGAFEALLSHLRISSQECLMIDNEPANIQEAERLGFDTILFQDLAGLQKELDRRGIFSAGSSSA